MGAWEAGSFENDTALDWVHGLCQTGDASTVRTALELALAPPAPESPSLLGRLLGQRPADSSLPAETACEALAAAEIVAFWLGRPVLNFPTYLAEWAIQHAEAISPELTSLALQAVATIMTKSALKDLWEESDGIVAADWHQAMADLEQRLEPPSP